MVKQDMDAWLPEVGERVAVEWGLDSVTGQVVESYASGSRPRAVVEIDAGEVGEEKVRVTLPLSAIRPLGTESEWSKSVQFERSAAKAIERNLTGQLQDFERPPSSQPAADLYIRLVDGRILIVEVKWWTRSMSGRGVEQAVKQLRSYVERIPNAKGLLIVNGDTPTPRMEIGRDMAVAVWRDQHDDQPLREALQRVLSG